MDLECIQTRPIDGDDKRPDDINAEDELCPPAGKSNPENKYHPLVYREPEERIPKLDSDVSDHDTDPRSSRRSRRSLPMRYASHSSRDSSPASDTQNPATNNNNNRTIPKVRLSSVLAKRRRDDLDDDYGNDPSKQQEEEDLDSKKRKEELMQSQRNNRQVFDRNKRMFGMLMGTLKKFKTEETSREEITLKRSKIDEKLESTAAIDDAAVEAREVPRFAYNNNDVDDEERSEIIDKAELKLDILGRHKNWESSHKQLIGFIQTETKPKIFWQPKEQNQCTEKQLKSTRDYYNLFMAERAAKCKKELDDLEKAPLKDLIEAAAKRPSRESTRSPSPRRRYQDSRRRDYRSPASDSSSNRSYRRH